MNDRLLFFIGIKFVAIKLFYKILIGGIADFSGKLPIIGQKLLVLPSEPAAKITRRLEVFAAIGPSEPVFAGIVD